MLTCIEPLIVVYNSKDRSADDRELTRKRNKNRKWSKKSAVDHNFEKKASKSILDLHLVRDTKITRVKSVDFDLRFRTRLFRNKEDFLREPIWTKGLLSNVSSSITIPVVDGSASSESMRENCFRWSLATGGPSECTVQYVRVRLRSNAINVSLPARCNRSRSLHKVYEVRFRRPFGEPSTLKGRRWSWRERGSERASRRGCQYFLVQHTESRTTRKSYILREY